MKNKLGKTGGRVKHALKRHGLSTPEKYKAFRGEHPELNLPSHITVLKKFAARRWDW